MSGGQQEAGLSSGPGGGRDGTWGGHSRGFPRSSSLMGERCILLGRQALLQGLNALLSCCGSFQVLSLLIGQL